MLLIVPLTKTESPTSGSLIMPLTVARISARLLPQRTVAFALCRSPPAPDLPVDADLPLAVMRRCYGCGHAEARYEAHLDWDATPVVLLCDACAIWERSAGSVIWIRTIQDVPWTRT
jgi:hypothetical protein